MKKILPIFLVSIFLLSFAEQALAQFDNTKTLLLSVKSVFDILIILLITGAVVVLFWGLITFVYNVRSGSEDAVKKGKTLMIWGIVAIFVMVTLWAIVGFMQDALGLPNTSVGGSRIDNSQQDVERDFEDFFRDEIDSVGDFYDNDDPFDQIPGPGIESV